MPAAKNHTSHQNLRPTQFPQPYSNTALFCPTNLRAKKVTFEFLLRPSVFYFLFSAIPTGFLTFCLPADEATAKSVTKYSPTDSEKQTAIDCKDNGLFSLTKASLCQKTIHVSQNPARAAVARYARNGACLVCVCVCISSKDMLFALFV